jgi:uncharacterized protein
MIHPDTELQFISGDVGYGVFATRPIPRGTLVWTLCHFDQIYTPEQVARLTKPYQDLIDRFAYINPDANYVLCWDAGRYVNHSCDPTMLPVGRDFEVLVRDIAPGDQLTCDYAGCNLANTLSCRCGASNCRGAIGGADVLTLCDKLDRTVSAAMQLAHQVRQPLLDFAQDRALFIEYANGKRAVPSQREHYVDTVTNDRLPGRAKTRAAIALAMTESNA